MSTWIKRIFILLTTLVVVGVCALFAFILSFDANAYKADLQRVVKERTHRELTIAGDLKVELFPKLAITVRDVSLTEPRRPDRFASIDELRASMALLPLLKNQVVIDELAAKGIRASLTRRKDGTLSIDDLLNWPQAEEMPVAGPELLLASENMTIDVAGIRIADSDITVRDEQGQANWQVSDLQLSTGRILSGAPADMSLAGLIRGPGFEKGTNVTAKALVTMDFSAGKASVRDLVIVAKGQLPGLDWVPDPIAGLEVVLRAPVVAVQTKPSRIRFERLSVRAKGQQPAGAMEFALDAPDFSWTQDAIGARALTSRLRQEGARTVDMSVVADGLAGSTADWKFTRLDVDLNTKLDTRTTHAFISSPVHVRMHPLAVTLSEIRGDVKVTQTTPKPSETGMTLRGNLALEVSDQANQARPVWLRGGFRSIPLDTAWVGMGVDTPIDGVASLSLDLRSRKGGLQEMADSILGTAQLKIEQAAIRGIDLSEGLDAVRALAKQSADGLQFKGNPAKRTMFDTIALDTRIDGHLATFTKLDMQGATWRVALGKPAEINLRDGTANLGLVLHLRNPQAVTAGKVTVEVRSLAVPLRLTGPLHDPVIHIDWNDLARDRLGNALKQKLLEGGLPNLPGFNLRPPAR